MSLDDSIVSCSSDILPSDRYEEAGTRFASNDGFVNSIPMHGDDFSKRVPDKDENAPLSSPRRKRTTRTAAKDYPPRAGKTTSAQNRANIREQRRLEKQLQKESAFRNLVAERIKHGYYCKQETGLVLSQSVYDSELGISLRRAKADSDEEDTDKEQKEMEHYPILPPRSEVEIGYLPSIWWCRGRVQVMTLNCVRITFPETLFSMIPGDVNEQTTLDAPIDGRFSKVEPFVIIYLTGRQFVDLLHEKSLESIQSLFTTWKQELPVGFKLIVLVTGLKKAWQSKYKSKGKAFTAYVSYEAYEHLATSTFVTIGVELRFIESIEKAVSYVLRTTKSVAEMPYRTTPSAIACTTKVKVTGKFKPYKYNPVRSMEESDGALERALSAFQYNTSSEAWWMMLQMIPGVSPAVANAIVSKVPSFHYAMQIYLDPRIPEAAKKSLFEDLYDENGASIRRHGRLSEDIFSFLTSLDGNAPIREEK